MVDFAFIFILTGLLIWFGSSTLEVFWGEMLLSPLVNQLLQTSYVYICQSNKQIPLIMNHQCIVISSFRVSKEKLVRQALEVLLDHR